MTAPPCVESLRFADGSHGGQEALAPAESSGAPVDKVIKHFFLRHWRRQTLNQAGKAWQGQTLLFCPQMRGGGIVTLSQGPML